MASITLKSHDIKTKFHAVTTYLNNHYSVLHVTTKYHISKASLMRWVKQFDGTIESLMNKSRRPKTPHPNSCTDTGIGMSEEYVSHIFDEFSREKTSTVSNIQGTGLGMSIVKKTVDLLGGSINVKSKQGEGTIITILIPMKSNLTEEVKTFEEVSKTPRISLKGKKVLLVEDNEMNREIAQDILEDEGIIVETASDGDIAVEKVKKIIEDGNPKYYDVILMDFQMPRMNGYEATKAI